MVAQEIKLKSNKSKRPVDMVLDRRLSEKQIRQVLEEGNKKESNEGSSFRIFEAEVFENDELIFVVDVRN